MRKISPFIIYDASAGSGKTFTLVRNYLSRLLLSPDITTYRNLLAITFTNKAVAEMKSRIIESLKGFSADSISDQHLALFKAVQSETGLTEKEIRQKSEEILQNILHNYASFEVSTIDSFTQRILRTFAKDLNIPLNFEVSLETEEILQEAVDRVLAKAGKPEHKNLTQALIDFALFKTDDDKSWDISYDLDKIAKLLVNDNHLPFLEILEEKKPEDFAAFTSDLKNQIKSLTNLCKQSAEDFFSLIEAHNLLPEHFSRKSIPNFFKKINKGKMELGKLYDKPKWVQNIDNPDYERHYTKNQLPEIKQTIDNILPEIARLYFTIEDAIKKIMLYKDIIKTNPSLSLLSAIQDEVKTIKEERNILLISEFNRRIYKSIKDEPAPFIYERLGEKYHTFYIDEFQDTSDLQWENLLPLVADSLATERGQLTLVGDAKQSIYRWRGGKPEQFMDLINHENPFHLESFHERLPYNYRSKYEIINFNNTFFQHCSQFLRHPPYQTLFQEAAQKPFKETGGYVEIDFIQATNKKEREENYPQKILELIYSLSEKGYTYNQICILVRIKDYGVIIADYLNQHEIPIISSETLLLNKSKEINFLIALLEFSLNPREKSWKFEILNFLYDHIQPEESLFEFVYPRLPLEGNTFFHSLKDYKIDFDLHKLQYLPFYDAIEYSIRAFNLLEKADAYLQFFLDFVFDFTEKNSGGIIEFLDLWELKKDKLSISIPEGGEAIQIMTIHKAKGLEFPIVIYPFANEKMDDTRQDNLWIPLEDHFKVPLTYLGASKTLPHLHKNAERVYQELLLNKEFDAMNLFYVALTRAEEQLYIISELDGKKLPKPNSFSGLLINYLQSLNLWEENQTNYSFGEITIKNKTAEKPQHLYLDKFISSAPENHQIEILTGSGQLWGSLQEKALEEGKLIHNLLQEIHTASDIDKTLEKAVFGGEILESEVEKHKQILENIVFHSDLSMFFTDHFTIYTEKEIVSEGEIKRLDRLCIRENKATIIDYKTGTPHPDHKNQLHSYSEALRGFGFEIENKILVYLNEQIDVQKLMPSM